MIGLSWWLSRLDSIFDSVVIATTFQLGDTDVVDDQADRDACDGASDGQQGSQLLRDSPAAHRSEGDLVVVRFLHVALNQKKYVNCRC